MSIWFKCPKKAITGLIVHQNPCLFDIFDLTQSEYISTPPSSLKFGIISSLLLIQWFYIWQGLTIIRWTE